MAAACDLPRVLQGHACDRQGPSSRQRIDDLLYAIDAQAAGRPVAGVTDPGARFADREARQRHVQRSLSDAHIDVAAIRDHCVVRRGRCDDGATGRHCAGRGKHPGSARLPPRNEEGRRRMGPGLVVPGVGPGSLLGKRDRFARRLDDPRRR